MTGLSQSKIVAALRLQLDCGLMETSRLKSKSKRPKYWSNWREDPKLAGIVASYEICIDDRLCVVAITNTGVPILEIVSPRDCIRKRAKEAGLVFGTWPTDDGQMKRGWLPGRPDEPQQTNPYLIEKK
tara:strand:- start:988 stop:1371 length:384 start_codon:yes stop_codon:yes gene_type:complete